MSVTNRTSVDFKLSGELKISGNIHDPLSTGKWMLKWPGQVVLAVSCLYWTINVTKGIENRSLMDYFEEVNYGIRE